ncbi:MAG: TonB-dependent receptor plug domain-containing protein, partial [Halioglobus sp.]
NTRKPIALLVAAVISTAAATAQSQQLEEVLVTAQKRTESAQDIPVALTAVSAATIEAMGITQTQDLTKLSSSLTMKAGNSKQNSAFSLRGVGTQVYSVGVEQSVAIIIDDVSTVQAGQAIGNLVDIERIEILRGPQSTLFGKSASAGVLSIITKRPSEELEGSVELTLTDENSERVLGSIS